MRSKARGYVGTIAFDVVAHELAALPLETADVVRIGWIDVHWGSHPEDYLETLERMKKPSMDRIAETIHKFEEDAFDKNEIHGHRSVEITFCAPINLMDHLDSYAADSKATIATVTAQIESEIKGVLE